MKIETHLMDFKRLQWACRRGMLELDLILAEFLSTVYPTLTGEQQSAFQKLLESPDPELLHWCMSKSDPTDPHLMQVVEIIRKNMIIGGGAVHE